MPDKYHIGRERTAGDNSGLPRAKLPSGDTAAATGSGEKERLPQGGGAVAVPSLPQAVDMREGAALGALPYPADTQCMQ